MAVTDYRNYALEGYEVNVFRYVIKSEAKDKLEKAMREAQKRLFCIRKESYSVKIISRTIINVLLAEILYFESRSPVVFIHLQNDEHRMYGKLDEVGDKLEKFKFIRVHKSYLVNYRHIKLFKNGVLMLNNGEELPVSREHSKKAKEIFTLYVTGVE